jgi:uncharacterized protein (TIGR02271 family)
MTTPYDPAQLQNATVVDSAGDKIGDVGQVYLNDETGQPEWVTVSTGLFGRKQSFAPVYGSQLAGDTLTLAVTKDAVKNAPNVDPDGHTDDSEQQALYDYYAGHLGAGQASGAQYTQTAGTEDTSAGRSTDTGQYVDTGADTERAGSVGADAMTRSEERVSVGTEQVETGRARLRKYVVTENVTQTVPVSREEVRVERVPITEENRGEALSGPDITEAEHEVTLHAERPVVQKEAVPVEQVRLGTETVTDEQTVQEQVRKEQIDVDHPNTETRTS